MTNLEIMEAAVKLGRKLDRMKQAEDKIAAESDKNLRLRHAAKRGKLLFGAPEQVRAQLSVTDEHPDIKAFLEKSSGE